VLSRATAGIFDDEDVPGVGLRDLGEQLLKDFDRPERVYQLRIRRMMRRMHELSAEQFGVLLRAYQRLVSEVLEESGGRQIDVAGDSVSAGFASPRQAVLAAAAVQRAVAEHAWPQGLKLEVSIGIHSGEAAVGWLGRAILRCGEPATRPRVGRRSSRPLRRGCSKTRISPRSRCTTLAKSRPDAVASSCGPTSSCRSSGRAYRQRYRQSPWLTTLRRITTDTPPNRSTVPR
jgi:hypothetical protein